MTRHRTAKSAGVVTPMKVLARRAGIRRSSVAAFRTRCERLVLAASSRRRQSGSGRILCYHSVGTPAWGINDISPERFREQLELALHLGYRFVPADAIAQGAARPNDLAVTFDDGLMSVASNAAPILAELAIPWTVFVVSGWTEGSHGFGDGVIMGWSDIEKLAAAGVEIGSHSVTHPDFGSLAAPDALEELVRSRKVLQERTGIRVKAFAIPFGQSKNWSAAARVAAEKAGYQFVYAQSALNRPAGTIARTFITRFDDHRLFKAAIEGAFDRWEEWL